MSGSRASLRRVVQISAAAGTFGESSDFGIRRTLFALCDDGTVWKYSVDTTSTAAWEELPAIPSAEP